MTPSRWVPTYGAASFQSCLRHLVPSFSRHPGSELAGYVQWCPLTARFGRALRAGSPARFLPRSARFYGTSAFTIYRHNPSSRMLHRDFPLSWDPSESWRSRQDDIERLHMRSNNLSLHVRSKQKPHPSASLRAGLLAHHTREKWGTLGCRGLRAKAGSSLLASLACRNDKR
jgi:hypothetical protein